MVIEKALIEDVEEILKIQKKAFLSEGKRYDDYTLPPLAETLEEAREDFKKRTVLKVVKDGQIIAGVRILFDGKTYHVGKLFVHPDFQGKGIGTKLLQYIEEHFQETNRYEIFAGSLSFDNIRLYEKMGYKRFKTEKYNEKAGIVFLEKEVVK